MNLTNVNVGAVDNNFTGAWSGAGALNFRGADSGKTSVAMTGAVAVNKVDSNVEANISTNKNLTGEINNEAKKSGALIAAGLGLTVSNASSESNNYTGAASASVNLSDNVTKAIIKDNTVTTSPSIKNTATNTDTQVTGGVNVSVAVGGKKGVAAGGTGVWSDISNDVNAIIDGGTYKTSGALNNIVSTTLTDVAGGVGVSVAQGSESSYGFQGVFTYNKIQNNSHADIKNADITANSLVNSSSDNKNAAKAYDKTLTDAGLDVSGDSYSEFAKVGESDSTQKSIESQSTGGKGVEADESVGYKTDDYGNKIITAALVVAGAGDGAAQASVAISDVDNDFKAEVTNSKLSIENKTDINATSNTLDINAAAGAAVSSKGFGVGGSVSWQTNDNEVVAGFDGGDDKKSLTTSGLDVTTENHALEVNVGGQISGGKGAAAGLAMAYNALNDNTESYFKNTELTGTSKNSEAVDVNINANSSGKVYAVGAGVAASGNSAALNGSIAVNHGSNSTQSILENIKSEDVKNLNVNAEDSVKKLAVVGGLTLSGGSVAVGGSVAYNDVGSSANKQLTKVTMKGNDITASENVSVNTNDTSDLLTVGVGIGASSKVAVQGSAAVATLNKDVGISLDNSTIKANAFSLKAKTAEDLITTADVLSIGGNVGVGAGVSVNNDYTKTGVAINNSNLTANNYFNADSSNSAKVLTIGIGGAAGGTAGVTGSVAVNNLRTDTSNTLDNVTLNSTKGILINAKGDEAIANYAGTISASGSGAAVGLSVSVNNINSDVKNVITESEFKKADESKENFFFAVDDSIDKKALLNAVVEKETFKPSDTLATHRVNNSYKGVVIDASATHDIKSALFNIGVAGSGAAVNGTVNVNRISGLTSSSARETSFNIDSDINILANDFSNAAGLVGTASAAGTGAGIGIGSDSAVINRGVKAFADMHKTDSDGNDVVNKAKDVNIKSVSQQGVGSLIAGVAFAGAGVGASNGVGVSLVDGMTNSYLYNTKGEFDNLNVTNDHLLNLNTLGVSFGAAVIGASGVKLTRNADSNAAINFNNANIETEGSQNFNATNDLGYKLDLEAAGYGGLNASAGDLEDKTNYSANINVNNSKLTATGINSSLTLNTQTTGNASSLNNLKAAGAIEVVTSSSDINTTFDNQINLKNSTLKTEGNESAIRLASNDNTEQKYHTIANLQGGAAGIAVANTNNLFNRSNSVKLNNSTIDAANNVYLNSGYNFEDIPSKLTMTVFADVYNKAVVPLSTAPSLKNDLKINNAVDINSGSKINAVRNVNINAESGTSVITESAKEYNIYSGTGGKGNVVVTTGHEGNAYETANNYVNIDGKINAGIHNSLKMTISGGNFSSKESEKVDPTVTITEGNDIFYPSSINFDATATMENPFLADYKKVLSDMQAYTPGSSEYRSLYDQVLGMERVMAAYGFAEKMGNTNQYIVYDKIEAPAMELPDIELAGGNIDINTPKLRGSGTLNANAAKELTINNKTERTLLVNNLTMDTAGGRIYLNDISTTKSGNLTLNTQSDYTPAITVNNTGKAIKIEASDNSYAYSKAPDIILNSGKKITNSAGSVTLKNSNGSVLLNGEIYSLTSTKVSTPNGGTIISNTRGTQNVGEDPMLKYTFGSDGFSKWLQEAIVTQKTSWFDGYKKDSSTEKLTFNNYEHYLNFVYQMALKYDTSNITTHRQYLSDAAGTSSWYTGNFNDDWNRWKSLMLTKYDTTSTVPTGSIISGGAISIIAKTLNVNGLIQSGFNRYIGEVDLKVANDIQRYGKKTLDDDAVIGDNQYRVNTTEAEISYNPQSGMYDKIVGLYINPQTNNILTDSIQTSGGVIYLQAQDVISTGNGKIVAAGGGADININSGVTYPLIVKDINTVSRPAPLIMINGVNHTNSSEYRPNSKSVYAWTGGINYNKIEKKSSETTELLWGLFKIKSTKDLVEKLTNEKIAIHTISTSDPPKEGNNLQNGVFTDYSGDGNFFTITTARKTGDKVYGETSVSSKDKDIWDWIIDATLPIGRTTYIYTWTETTPNYAGSTYRINAAQPIKIQTSNKTDSTINITNTGAINVDSAWETGANGTINLTSRFYGINTSEGNKITSAKLNLTSAKDVDVTLGLPENKSTELKVKSFLDDPRKAINVKINANTPLENLDISNGENVNIVSVNDVSGNINAKNLDIATPGNIDLTTKVTEKITAQGDESVKVTQTDGDLKIGKIASKGDVNLTASNGAIVNYVDTAVNMTGSADKVEAWKAAGLINNKDSASSATNAAKEEKAIRLKSLENLFSRWALKDDGTVDQALYKKFINGTVDESTLTEEQLRQVYLYQDLKSSTDYGFSKNQLLYAIQESLLNPSAGLTASISDPIITGKNITLNAKSLGKELAPVTYSDLTSLKTLKKLAGAKSGDVTFNDNGSITLNEQSPITVEQSATENKLNITTQGNTFISGTSNTKFNVNTPIDAGDNKVVLMTGNGIDANKGITAKDIELYAGAGELNAKLIASETPDSKETITENIIITTITCARFERDGILDNIFDEYKDLPGFSLKFAPAQYGGSEPLVLYILTAEYTSDDNNAINAVERAMQTVKTASDVFKYSRTDKNGTRTVEINNNSVGTLTANAFGDINIYANNNLPIENVTSSSNINITADGNIVPVDKNSRVQATNFDTTVSTNVKLTATKDIGTKSNPLQILADNITTKAQNAYTINAGGASGGEDEEIIDNGNNNSNSNGSGNNSGNNNHHSNNSSTKTPTNITNTLTSTNTVLVDNPTTNTATSVDNVTIPANTVSADNPTTNTTPTDLTDTFSFVTEKYGLLRTKATNLLDRFSYLLNKYGFSNTTGDNVLTPANTTSVDNMTVTDNTVSEYNFITNMMLIRLPDNSIYILDKNEPLNTTSTAQNKEHYNVALALSRSLAFMNNSGDAYNAAAKVWLNGMGYSEEEEQQIIDLSLEIASSNHSGSGVNAKTD